MNKLLRYLAIGAAITFPAFFAQKIDEKVAEAKVEPRPQVQTQSPEARVIHSKPLLEESKIEIQPEPEPTQSLEQKVETIPKPPKTKDYSVESIESPTKFIVPAELFQENLEEQPPYILDIYLRLDDPNQPLEVKLPRESRLVQQLLRKGEYYINKEIVKLAKKSLDERFKHDSKMTLRDYEEGMRRISRISDFSFLDHYQSTEDTEDENFSDLLKTHDSRPLLKYGVVYLDDSFKPGIDIDQIIPGGSNSGSYQNRRDPNSRGPLDYLIDLEYDLDIRFKPFKTIKSKDWRDIGSVKVSVIIKPFPGDNNWDPLSLQASASADLHGNYTATANVVIK